MDQITEILKLATARSSSVCSLKLRTLLHPYCNYSICFFYGSYESIWCRRNFNLGSWLSKCKYVLYHQSSAWYLYFTENLHIDYKLFAISVSAKVNHNQEQCSSIYFSGWKRGGGIQTISIQKHCFKRNSHLIPQKDGFKYLYIRNCINKGK